MRYLYEFITELGNEKKTNIRQAEQIIVIKGKHFVLRSTLSIAYLHRGRCIISNDSLKYCFAIWQLSITISYLTTELISILFYWTLDRKGEKYSRRLWTDEKAKERNEQIREEEKRNANETILKRAINSRTKA